jgi:hypothetical protein
VLRKIQQFLEKTSLSRGMFAWLAHKLKLFR